MNEKADAIAAQIATVEQRLLVAVVQGDDRARSLARREITGLKNQLPPAALHHKVNNDDPKPFVWSKTAIKASQAWFCLRTSNSRH